ncbi:MAG: WD40 repeat domain-containing protein, partial [Candidatus Hydrogenedentes bacterium]|nr:WD40 repeat domain-containing protein [Candidatus Hydrogenedentota bacterium]
MCAIRPAALLILAAALAQGQIVISGNENKIDLTSGEAKIVPNAPPDSISILRFTEFPPKAEHITGVRNSVIGPPSNIAISPDEKLALIASSLSIDPRDATKWIPDNVVHVLDLTQRPPQVIQEVKVDKQPSGISITRDGRYTLVANRASGTVSLLGIEGKRLSLLHTEKVCDAAENISDIAIHPNGEVAIASVCKGRYLIILRIEHGRLVVTERKLTVYGEPYRCAISPDGTLAVTAGSGLGMPDIDAVTVVDLTSDPIRTSDYIPIPSGPESLEISPDGKQLAVVVMNGSNLAPDKPLRTDHGLLVVLSRRGNTFVKTQELPTGRIPEGVAYAPDGRYIIVQTHPDKELWLYEVQGEKVVDTGKRIAVPGFPSSIRIAEPPFGGPVAAAPAAAPLRESPFFAMCTGTKDDRHVTAAAQADMLKQ